MIQIAPVDYPKLPVEFDYLRVDRVGGIAGVRERVRVEPAGGVLGCMVHPHIEEPREFLLDASQARHLLATIHPLVAMSPQPPAPPRGADMYSYVVEIGWGGRSITFEVHGVPGDDALHGVLEFAMHLLTVTA